MSASRKPKAKAPHSVEFIRILGCPKLIIAVL